ncbi:MAG TPA: NAD-dependent succinate-semialdehyde dehydrogenase [Burkholderiaceae bacterium]|nr:NAD-dependent succinate-semialdehyde dehydrogenase [Burkholderiaceae bacterium]
MTTRETQPPRLADVSLIQTQAFINGEFIGATDDRFPVRNPATGDVLAWVGNNTAEQALQAVAAAKAAFPRWRGKPAKERAAILHRWYELIMAAQDDLAKLMTAEQGKPLAESRGEIAYGASFIQWYAEEGKRVYGDIIPTHAPDRRLMVSKEPIGVCAAITPWNFPNAMITRKCAPALAAGCTVVLKPAEQTPLSALALAQLALRAGFPPGVINIVTADGQRAADVGLAWCQSQDVRKLSFTGSTEVGRLLMRQCADTVKKLSLELGGNAPFIVFDDADLDAAVQGALASKYRNSGQTCICVNRFYAQRSIYDRFIHKLAAQVGTLTVGDGSHAGVDQGPLIDQSALKKVQAHVDDAMSKGARVMVGGKAHKLGGTFYEPTVLADAHANMLLAREETFGPVAAVFPFDSEQEVIAAANDTEYGLASYVYARDMGRIVRVCEGLDYGMVGVNVGLISSDAVPFGGVKQSGFGREGSKYGIDEYLSIKYLCLGGITPAQD